MVKLKKDGTPKNSGGVRVNTGRKETGVNQTPKPFKLDNDLLDWYNGLDNKNGLINDLLKAEKQRHENRKALPKSNRVELATLPNYPNPSGLKRNDMKYESNFQYLKSSEFAELKKKFDFDLTKIGLEKSQCFDYAKKVYPYFDRIKLNNDGTGTYILCENNRRYNKEETYVTVRVDVIYVEFENFKPVSYKKTGEYVSL
jgi:hypothetical protein